MSSGEQSVQDLEKPDELSHQQWEWTLERIAWLLGGLLLLAGLLGLLGRGPLAHTMATSTDQSLSVQYHFIERYQADTELRLIVPPADSNDRKTVRVSVSRSFLDHTTPLGAWPPPLSSGTEDDRVVFTFQLGDSAGEREIVYHYKHETFGKVHGEFAVNDGQPVKVSQYVLP